MAVAVDANIDNLRRLAKSLILGQFQSLVTVVHNAVRVVRSQALSLRLSARLVLLVAIKARPLVSLFGR